ncbi:uncharacterized mitochondrial protein AtMg00810-like [Humulus lupulus]|uniref:uncharacterized mitochondrial protein AtMg00810-like n=1 Tax=Humulus lupulus TaxID=3486 RepID=UPI002B40D52D|nr:uncharacterized mitochondrial protein AtMg00810-like [Humulus lupulus]
MLKTPKFVVIVLIYVDDIIVTGNNREEIHKFICMLNKEFTLKDLGSLHYFLGIKVFTHSTGMYLTQGKYIEELLQRVHMPNLKPSPTPMTAGKSLSINDWKPLNNLAAYRSVIGALQYLSHTRPDIAFSVNKLSQFLKSPIDTHWSAAKRILRYLKGTQHHGLHIIPSNNLNLIGFSDADWACYPDDRRSVGGYCVFMGDTLISWSSKKQTVVARSSTESEYRSLAHLTAELSWIQGLLKEMRLKISSTPVIWCDNMSASALASNPVYHARTKHIELDIHFVRDKVIQGKLEIRHVPSHDQLADCLRKGLSHTRFRFLIDKLGIRCSPSRLRGGVKEIEDNRDTAEND